MISTAILILTFVRLLLGTGVETSNVVKQKTELGSDPPRRVLYGTKADESDFPYLVGLYMPNSLCGGSIIDNHWILTAAHCIRSVPCNEIKIKPATWKESENVYPSECFYHEQHVIKKYEYDIGLLRVDLDLLQDGRAAAIKLPEPGVHYPPGTSIVIAGWGRDEHNQWPYALMRANLNLENWETCNKRFIDHHPPGNGGMPLRVVCLESDGTAPPGTCFGDSGGPAVTPDGVVIGIASFLLTENDFCKYDGPSLFTSVVDYLPWIYRHVDPSRETSNYPVSPEHIVS